MADYSATRDRTEHYFERTATKVWERLTSDAPVSRIRETVRKGRDRMRAAMMARLPDDLRGARVLDAGCGTGLMTAELAARGADVGAVDISPQLISIAQTRISVDLLPKVRFASGDMLAESHGWFDYVMAKDSLIYYTCPDIAAALDKLGKRTAKAVVFTVAPRTPFLMTFFTLGKAFPRSDRSPVMIPQAFVQGSQAGRLLMLVVIGTMGFQMPDVLLEPCGGQILGLSGGATTWLTAANALGALTGFFWQGVGWGATQDTFRMAARGILIGIAAFSAVILSGLIGSVPLFYIGASGIGLGAGVFAVSTLTVAMALPERGKSGRGLALGAWGAAQATAAGLSIAVGGAVRDGVGAYALHGNLGAAFTSPSFGYSAVYSLEIIVLFVSLVTLGPLVRTLPYTPKPQSTAAQPGIMEFPT